MIPIVLWPSSSRGLRLQVAPAHEVVRRRAKGKDPIHESAAAMAEFAKQGDGLQPAKRLLDQFPLALADHIAGVTPGPRVDGAAAATIDRRRDVRRDAHLPDSRHPVARVVQLAAPTRPRRRARRKSADMAGAASPSAG